MTAFRGAQLKAMARTSQKKTGKVTIVGGGPGDPRLLTLAAVDALRSAEAVVVDRILGIERFSPYIDKKAKVLLASDGDRGRQSSINRFMSRCAQEGLSVVRLKNGDPMIFGRGLEEAQYLAKRKIPFSFIPGISALNAAATLSGFGLTHRGVSDSVYFVTGHNPERHPWRWKMLVDFLHSGTTLCLFMAVKNVSRIAQILIENGADENLDICLVERAAGRSQKVRWGRLSTACKKTWISNLKTPGIIYVGKVLKVSWRES